MSTVNDLKRSMGQQKYSFQTPVKCMVVQYIIYLITFKGVFEEETSTRYRAGLAEWSVSFMHNKLRRINKLRLCKLMSEHVFLTVVFFSKQEMEL